VTPRPIQLKPARPDVDPREAAGYAPKPPWRWAIALLGGFLFLLAGWWIYEYRSINSLTQMLIVAHNKHLAQVRGRYSAFEDYLYRKIEHATQTSPQPLLDKALTLKRLRSTEGLYFTWDDSEALTRDALRQQISVAKMDALPSCLGIRPASVRGIYEHGDFLRKEWLSERMKGASLKRLEVTDYELRRRIRQDIPLLAGLLKSSWLLIVIRHKDSRDIWLWNLRTKEALLQQRVAVSGRVIQARLGSAQRNLRDAGDQRAASRNTALQSAQDCAVAADIRKLFESPD